MKILHLTLFHNFHPTPHVPFCVNADRIIAFWPYTHKRIIRKENGNPDYIEGMMHYEEVPGTIIQFGVGGTEDTGTLAVTDSMQSILERL